MKAAFVVLVCLVALALAAKTPSKSWTWNARSAKLDPKSATLVRTMMTYAFPRKGVLVMCKWGVAMATAKKGDPYYKVKLLKPGSGRLDPKIRIPKGTRPNLSPDAALSIYDPVSGREHDFWRAKYNPKTGRIVSAVNGNSFPAGSDSSVDKDGQKGGANLANVPLNRGIVSPEDLISGHIDQVMQMAMPEVGKGGPRFPAVHSLPRTAHGSTNPNVGPNRMTMGTWLRLDPGVNVQALNIPAWQKTIARGLQDHGMIFRDFARTLIIYGKDPVNGGKKWIDVPGIKPGHAGANACKDGDAKGAEFSENFPWSRLQVLQPPPHKKIHYSPRKPSDIKKGKCWGICLKTCKKAGAGSRCNGICLKKCAKKGKN